MRKVDCECARHSGNHQVTDKNKLENLEAIHNLTWVLLSVTQPPSQQCLTFDWVVEFSLTFFFNGM
jgi:hypothetical protein